MPNLRCARKSVTDSPRFQVITALVDEDRSEGHTDSWLSLNPSSTSESRYGASVTDGEASKITGLVHVHVDAVESSRNGTRKRAAP
jgi:hypothetical protein